MDGGCLYSIKHIACARKERKMLRKDHPYRPLYPPSTSRLHRTHHSRGATPDELTLPFTGTEMVCPVFFGAEQFVPAIYASVDRGFFVADGKWTCYRRNYFQTHIQVALAPNLCLSHQQPIQSFQTTITSHVASDPSNLISLVQHTPKRDKGPQMAPALITIGQDEKVVFERIQFKSATANNGKRRAQQQFFVIRAELHATVAGQDPVLVAVSKSMPVVVRGRSPGHYADSCRSAGTCVDGYLPPSPPDIARRFPHFGDQPPLAVAFHTPMSSLDHLNYHSATVLAQPPRMPTPHSPTPSLSPTDVSPVPSTLSDEFAGYMYFPYPLVDCYEPHYDSHRHRTGKVKKEPQGTTAYKFNTPCFRQEASST